MSQHQQALAIQQQQHQVAAQMQMHQPPLLRYWVAKAAAHLALALAAAAQQQQVLAAAAAADVWPNRHPARIRRPGSPWCCAVGMHFATRVSASG
jgi:hypothetical protein